MNRICKKHGAVRFRLDNRSWRCTKCAAERVSVRRRRVKEILITEAGGKCSNPECSTPGGYNRYIGALEFHHRNPEEKSFGISSGGVTIAIDKLREEVKKCDLLCSNCHKELEAILSGEMVAAPVC